METNRRNFFRLSGLAGIGLVGSNIFNAQGQEKIKQNGADLSSVAHKQNFNMSGYAAPKIDKVRIGFVGLGNRGPGAVDRMSHIEGVEIKALCDLRPDRVDTLKKKLIGSILKPVSYTGDSEAWKKMCERKDIDLVYIATPWYLHTPIAVYWDMWRLKQNYRKGNLYPTHGLGPICQLMDINRGDQMDFLVSVSSNDFMMANMAKDLAAKDGFYKEFADKTFRGNMNTTTIRTKKGRTIMVQHDVTSPRPYSRIHQINGTKAMACKYPEPGRVSKGDNWYSEDEMKELEKKYAPRIVTRIGEMAKQVGGHGGMDFMMDWRTIDCLRNGMPLDQDVYDAALWSSIGPLTEWSVANRSQSVDVPDFTCGSWSKNRSVDILLKEGGTTRVI